MDIANPCTCVPSAPIQPEVPLFPPLHSPSCHLPTPFPPPPPFTLYAQSTNPPP